MEITLRKADALQREIKSARDKATPPVQVSITEFESPEEALTNAKSKVLENDERRGALSKAFYEIRRKVAIANAEGGITTLLADLAEIEDERSSLRARIAQAPMLSLAVIKGKIEKMKAAPAQESHYMSTPDQVTTGIYSEEEIESWKAQDAALRRKHANLKDTLLEKNTGLKISLSDEAQAALQVAGLI